MKALAIRTHFKSDNTDGDFSLLVYDGIDNISNIISSDVREIMSFRPNTEWVFILVPFMSYENSIEQFKASSVHQRGAKNISLIFLKISSNEIFIKHENVDGVVDDLNPILIRGWLFNLFDSRGAMIKAPEGVHFSKLSGRHTDKFLRVSNIFLNSTSVALVSFFIVKELSLKKIRKIFIDTSSLLSIGFFISKIREIYNISNHYSEIISFSSYGGVEGIPQINKTDIFLISASTSGGLTRKLVEKGANKNNIITLFQLKNETELSDNFVLCDLKYSKGMTFGYDPIINSDPSNCKLCQIGYFAAPLEGDQFILEKRAISRLRVSSNSQDKNARKVLEALSRKKLFGINMSQDYLHSNISFDFCNGYKKSQDLKDLIMRLLNRFTPSLLDMIILVNCTVTTFKLILQDLKLNKIYENLDIFDYTELSRRNPINRGNALVFIGYLNDHLIIRDINAQLRVKVPHGCVSYISALTIVESAQNYRELEIFLTYGEKGADTFTFKSAMSLMLPGIVNYESSWSQELNLLRSLKNKFDTSIAIELSTRLNLLESNKNFNQDSLFIKGLNKELAIAADFVYLDTHNSITDETISQADVFIIVLNLLSTARCNDEGLTHVPGKELGRIRKSQSIYGQILLEEVNLCPRNLRDYNDSILRAAFLRAAYPQEINYAVDENASIEVLSIIKAEATEWMSDNGNALPEILISMACGRLILKNDHLEQFKNFCKTKLKSESWIQQLVDEINK